MQSYPHVLNDEQMLDLMELAGYEVRVTTLPADSSISKDEALTISLRKKDQKDIYGVIVGWVPVDTPPSEIRRQAFECFLWKQREQNES